MFDRQTPPLFERLPAHIRTQDALQADRALEALMALMTDELQIVERDIDQLYDNWFVETCEPWALAYIAELIGAAPMREIDPARPGQLRAYVANLLAARAAKGTLAALEQVARDVTGWSVLGVEFFERLALATHTNHLRGGGAVFADVRNAAAARTTNSPFSQALHSPGAEPVDGASVRYNIPNLGLFIWRQSAMPLEPVHDAPNGVLGGPTPAQIVPGLLQFDPLGRDLPLVNRPAPDTEIADRITARRVPGTLSRDTLFRVLEDLRAGTADTEGWFGPSAPVVRVRLNGAEVLPAQLFCCHLGRDPGGIFRRPAQAGDVMFDPELGRLSLHPDDEGAPIETSFAHAAPFDIGGGPYDRSASVSSWAGHIWIEGEGAPWRIGVTARPQLVTDNSDQGGPVVASLADAIARWNAEAAPGTRGVITLLDNATYPQPLDGAAGLLLPPGSRLAIVAGDWPAVAEDGGVLRRASETLLPVFRRPVIDAERFEIRAADAGADAGAQLILDGFVLTGQLVLDPAGDLERLDLRHMTLGLDSSGRLNRISGGAGNARLDIEVAQSMLGGLDLQGAAGRIRVCDSILGERGAAGVLTAPLADGTIAASTLFGGLSLRTLAGENSLFLGPMDVARKQEGCVRYSFLPPDAAVPRRFNCVPGPTAQDRPGLRPSFTAARFDRAGFGQLSRCTPPQITQGAEAGREMGAGYGLRHPARLANLADAIAEFSPFGLRTGLHFIS